MRGDDWDDWDERGERGERMEEGKREKMGRVKDIERENGERGGERDMEERKEW